MEPSVPLSMRDHVAAVFKYKRMIIIIVVLTTGLVTAASYVMAPKYQATAQVLVKPGRQNAPPPTVVQRATNSAIYQSNLRTEDINSEVAILKSRALAEKAIQAIGEENLKPPLTRGEGLYESVKYFLKLGVSNAIGQVREFLYTVGLYERISDQERLLIAVLKELRVEQIRNTNVIEVEFRWVIPQTASVFVNTLVDLYVGYHLEVHQERQILGFFDDEVKNVEARLLNTEQELHRFKAETGVVSPSEQRSLLLERRSSLQADIEVGAAEIAGLAAKLQATQDQLDRDRQRLSFNSPAITQQLRQNYSELQVQAEGLRERQRVLKEGMSRIDARLKEIDQYEIQLNQLARSAEIERENFILYRSKKEEMSLDEKMDLNKIIDVAVIDPARVPSRPVRFIKFLPNKVLNIFGAFVGSFIGAILLALFRHHADPTVDTKRKVERSTGLRVLATVPELKGI